jgi:hypothetical protein
MLRTWFAVDFTNDVVNFFTSHLPQLHMIGEPLAAGGGVGRF